jgi:carbon-monoxide dehydrogenase medium subunit
MKPAPFHYVAPDNLEGALSALAEHGFDAKLLAGGQSLVPLLNFRLAQPAVLIDLNRLSELSYIRQADGGGLRIGAMTRQRHLEREPLVADRAPLLAGTVPYIAHPQIRNRGTVGGSLAHADPSSELPVVALALQVRFRLQSGSGERWVEADDFFTGLMTTDLAPDEILAEIELPPMPPRTGWSFQEIARRHGDYAQVGLAALVTLDEAGACHRARLVYLSVGEVPVVARQAAAALESDGLSPQTIEEAAVIAAEKEIEPTGDIHASADFKRHLARVLTVRALTEAHHRAQATLESR